DVPFFWSEIDLRGYRVTSRYLAETNPFAIGFMNLLVGYHIRKGYGWQACKKGTKKTPYAAGDGTATDPLVAKAQAILDQFRDRTQWPILSREAFYRWRVDGEVFLRSGWNLEDGIWARLVEPEQVGAPDGSTSDPWSYGIEVYEYPDGRVDPCKILAYHVWDLESGMTRGEWVDSKFITHAKANVVHNVKRGRPDFFPVIELFDGVRKLYTNMLLTAVDQAAIAWLEQFPTATPDQVRQIVPQQAVGGGQTVPADQSCGTWGAPWWFRGGYYGGGNKFRPGTIYRTEGNRQISPMPAGTAAAGFIEVEKLAMRAARMRWNFPGSASGDAEDTTFAAAIQAGGPFPVAVEGSQLHWGACFERPSALQVLDRATEAGLFTRAERALLDVEVTEPAVVTPEPDKDTQRRQTLNAAKVLSVTSWQLQEGLDPQHEAENFKAEAQREQAQQPPPNAPPGNPPPDGAGGALDGLLEGVTVSEGFTGDITDSKGRKRHYVNGKQVAKSDEPSTDPTATSASAPAPKTVRVRAPKHPQTAAAQKVVSVAHRRRVIAALKSEAELSTAIQGHNLPDSEPADVVHILDPEGKPVTDPEHVRKTLRQRAQAVEALRSGAYPGTGAPLTAEARAGFEKVMAQPAHFFEVKTLLTSPRDVVRMSKKAMARKERWVAKYGITFHTVAIDQRQGSKHSGHRVYVIPNAFSGTVRLDQMQKAPDMAAVLKAVQS
ncbi:MAG TPA: hypothetical protein VGE74_28175, partial [Gemmata sp.]